jgi:hypothetical protein
VSEDSEREPLQGRMNLHREAEGDRRSWRMSEVDEDIAAAAYNTPQESTTLGECAWAPATMLEQLLSG